MAGDASTTVGLESSMTQHIINREERERESGHGWDLPKQGPRMLAVIKAACRAFDTNRVLLCFLTGSLFTYLCLHLLRRIAF